MILVYEWIRFSRAGFLCENQLKENLRSTLDLYHRCTFQELAERNTEKMVLLSDEAFAKVDWHPENLKIYKRGQWNTRMIVETVLSILTLVCHFKQGDASGLGVFQEPTGLHDGDVQHAGPMGRH